MIQPWWLGKITAKNAVELGGSFGFETQTMSNAFRNVKKRLILTVYHSQSGFVQEAHSSVFEEPYCEDSECQKQNKCK